MRFILPLIVLGTLAGCASGPSEHMLKMQSYQDASEAKLIDELGPPDRQYDVDGTRYLSYTKSTAYTYRSGNPSFGIGGGTYERGGGVFSGVTFGDDHDAVDVRRCDTFFAIKNKRVSKVGFRGNAC
jgi:hypothetical protein